MLATFTLGNMDDEPLICDRCGHAFDAHSDRSFVPCVGAMRCGCQGWLRELNLEGW